MIEDEVCRENENGADAFEDLIQSRLKGESKIQDSVWKLHRFEKICSFILQTICSFF